MARSNRGTQSIIPPGDQEQEQEGGQGGGTNVPATRPTQTSLAPANERNVFEAYGEQFNSKMIVGRLLKFNKGDWLAGEDDEEIEEGTRFVANMNQLMIGWIKWVENKPAQQLMGSLASGFQPAKRSELGDNDEDEWETDQNGKPRDPWQYSNYLLLKPPGEQAEEDDLLTFATSSKGGISMMGELCQAYGKEMRTRPDEWPIVEIGVRSYMHSNREFGRIKVPTMKVVGWEEKSLFEYTPSSDEGDGEDEIQEERSRPAQRSAARAPAKDQGKGKGKGSDKKSAAKRR